MNIMIFAAAGRWSDQLQILTVPNGSTVAFYVADGASLSDDDGFSILNNLQTGNEPGGNVVESVGTGLETYNYSCWYNYTFGSQCGVYAVGSSSLIARLDQYTENNPLLLSQLLALYPACTIYWVACRDVAEQNPMLKTLISDAK